MNHVLTADEFLQRQTEGEVYGLFGSKVEGSISDLLHEKLFALGRRKAKYVLLKLEPQDLERVARSEKLAGFNVTIPYKQDIVPLLDRVAEDAAAVGAVNTVVCREGRLIGYNTDLYGIERTLARMQFDPRGKTALVLGTGGAALTAVYFLAAHGAQVTVASRTEEHLAAFAAKCAKSGATVSTRLYERLRDEYQLIVNCTPVGMYPSEDAQPLDIRQFRPEAVFDLVYNPLRTRLLKNTGARWENGLYMLVMQAVRAQELFFEATFSERDLERLYRELQALLFFKRLEDKYDREAVALCGFMGCGKSSVARMMARLAGVPVYDTDALVEARAGKSVADIFRDDGEAAFRDLESEVLQSLPAGRCVFSLGGGSVLREENVRAVKARARLVFLDVPLDVIRARVRNPASRPLFAGDGEALANLYDFRKNVYKSCADAVVYGETSEKVLRNLFENI